MLYTKNYNSSSYTGDKRPKRPCVFEDNPRRDFHGGFDAIQHPLSERIGIGEGLAASGFGDAAQLGEVFGRIDQLERAHNGFCLLYTSDAADE